MSRKYANELLKEHPIFKVKQELDFNCGPTAMTYCLSVLGFESDQDDLVGPVDEMIMRFFGTMPLWFGRVARENKIDHQDLVSVEDEDFMWKLIHATKDGAAILLVNSAHWVAVVGYEKGKFIINDPANEEKVLELWTEKKLLEEAYSENPVTKTCGYYAFSMKKEF